MHRRQFVGAAAVGAVGALAGCIGGFGDVDRAETIQQSVPAPEVADVRVLGAIGDVDVVGQGTGGVTVQVRKRARNAGGLDDVDVAIDLADGVLTVETRVDEGFVDFAGDSPSADVSITVPASGPGPTVSTVLAGVGEVTVAGTRGDARIHSGLGDVTASGIDGYVSLSTSLGAIRAREVAGVDHVHTDLGDVTVDVRSVRTDLSIGTELGAVAVGVAEDLGLDVLAETEGGITSNLPLFDSRLEGSRLSGRLNRGGYRLHAFSELGDVSLRSITR